MIMRNGKAAAGWRLDELRADMPTGMAFIAAPFAIVPDERNAERIQKAFSLLREWMDTPFFETRPEFDKWVAEFRPKVEAVISR